MTTHPLVQALRKPDPVTAEQVLAAYKYPSTTPVSVLIEAFPGWIADLERLGYSEAAEVARRDLGVLTGSVRRAA